MLGGPVESIAYVDREKSKQVFVINFCVQDSSFIEGSFLIGGIFSSISSAIHDQLQRI